MSLVDEQLHALTLRCAVAYTAACQIVHGNAQPIWERMEARMKNTTPADIQLTRARQQLIAVTRTWAAPDAVKAFQTRYEAALRHRHACQASRLYARASERRIH